jgi:multiple sugar transport system permease protein
MMKAGVLDTYFAVIVSFVAYNLPFGIWLLIGFVQMIPRELEEAAIIDGASRMQAFLRMIVPLVLPGLAAVGILVMIVCWREFFLPLILTSHNAKTLSVLAGTFMTEFGIDWGQLSAFAIITFLPVIAIAVYAQKYLISGLTMGAVKE